MIAHMLMHVTVPGHRVVWGLSLYRCGAGSACAGLWTWLVQL